MEIRRIGFMKDVEPFVRARERRPGRMEILSSRIADRGGADCWLSGKAVVERAPLAIATKPLCQTPPLQRGAATRQQMLSARSACPRRGIQSRPAQLVDWARPSRI